MSTSTLPADAVVDVSATTRVPFSRLVRVETRKMLDTRGGFWLMLVTGLLLFLVVGLALLVIALSDDARMTGADWSQVLLIPLSLLLPVIAILSVTTEWSQRSGLVTFTLEPRRMRVLIAKLGAVVVLALAIVLLAFVVGAIGNIVGAALGGYDVRWNLEGRVVVMSLVVQVLYFLMAFGIGTVLLNTPGSIVVFYIAGLLLPLMVYGALYAFFEWAQKLIPWIDMQYATAPFVMSGEDIGGVDVARLVTATCLWVVIPLAVGARRVLRSEPK